MNSGHSKEISYSRPGEGFGNVSNFFVGFVGMRGNHYINFFRQNPQPPGDARRTNSNEGEKTERAALIGDRRLILEEKEEFGLRDFALRGNSPNLQGANRKGFVPAKKRSGSVVLCGGKNLGGSAGGEARASRLRPEPRGTPGETHKVFSSAQPNGGSAKRCGGESVATERRKVWGNSRGGKKFSREAEIKSKRGGRG